MLETQYSQEGASHNIQPIQDQNYFGDSLKPCVTVITVVFNSAETLEETVRSVVNQTYDNVEYIIVDGGSTDGSLDIINKYENFIDYWVSEQDAGIYDAMNKGVVHASGEWALFMNSGDRFCCEATIASLIKKIIGNPDVVYGDVQILKNGRPAQIVPSRKMRTPLRSMPACHQSMMIKTKLLKQYPYDTKISIAADFDNLCRILTTGGVTQQVPIVVSLISGGGVSDTNRDMVYRQYQLISSRYFGVSITASLFFIRHRLWEQIKLRIKKIIGMAH
jgi:glycosyltransferase involved in cell wall biosynthesis